ncbi:MAG: hypothetical protein U0572_07675 [Phycisphaerales bacterium]
MATTSSGSQTTDLTDAIRENAAAGIARASGDSGTVEQMPVSEQIAADKYVKAAQANRRSPFGLRIAKILFGGTA